MSAQKSDHPIPQAASCTADTTSVIAGSGKHHENPKTRDSLTGALDPAAIYYTTEQGRRKAPKRRTFSLSHPNESQFSEAGHEKSESGTNGKSLSSPRSGGVKQSGSIRTRRASADTFGGLPVQWLVDVDKTLVALLKQEDRDGNYQITVDDQGPKSFELRTDRSGGFRTTDVRGTYRLSNLLQELTIAKSFHQKQIVLDEDRLNENPVDRLARSIKDQFWNNLTRRIDGSNIAVVARDSKAKDSRPRVYVPPGLTDMYNYYKRCQRKHPEHNLDVVWLSPDADKETTAADEYVCQLNEKPGLLAIAMEPAGTGEDGEPDFRGIPFVVPGGRFNELYGWDSYMETLGLLIHDRVDLAEGMVRHFIFSIRHYGKILNANRTYYLRRSQPPFLTDMALRVHDKIRGRPYAREFLKEAILAAIKDYYNTWATGRRLDKESGLSCYRPGGQGVPPETEATHFDHKLLPLAEKWGVTREEFIDCYNKRTQPRGHDNQHLTEDEKKRLKTQWAEHIDHLDKYFKHDRGIRESGHDTSYRLEDRAYDLATVDLNSLLYKYEVDVGRVIRAFFNDCLSIPEEWRAKDQAAFETSATWERRHRERRERMERLMWNEEAGMFFDYHVVEKAQTHYESATTFWTMWAGACTPRHAKIMVEKALPKLEEWGGLASGTMSSRGHISKTRPNRQWDYPFGWAPQQILAWIGLQRYQFHEDAQRLAYKWLHMVSKAYYDYNGVVVEKYDVTKETNSHVVLAEYGNQGSEFRGAATEGFGWVNASFIVGLQIVESHHRRALGALIPWNEFNMSPENRNLLGQKRKSAGVAWDIAHKIEEELLKAEAASPDNHAHLETLRSRVHDAKMAARKADQEVLVAERKLGVAPKTPPISLSTTQEQSLQPNSHTEAPVRL